MKRFFKALFWTVFILFIAVQFVPRPKKNISNHTSENDISVSHKTSVEVQDILAVSCYDCHSNNTKYPWYTNIQPISWWMGDHIDEGKKELNFSEFGTYSPRRQYRKLEEIIEEVEDGKMPLESYTLIHRNALLSAAEKNILVNWARNQRSLMASIYPADSLVRKQ